jgi:hypothetical protein
LEHARARLAEVQAPGYVDSLVGMTGAEAAIPDAPRR